MAAVRYTALRQIRSGHTIDTQYEIDLRLASPGGLVPVRNPIQHRAVAQDGATEIVVERREVRWNVATTHLKGTELLDVFEFLASVETGETFEFDPANPVASANYASAIMESIGAPVRTVPRGVPDPYSTDGDYFQVSFQIRML